MKKTELHLHSEEVKSFGGIYTFFQKYKENGLDFGNSTLYLHGKFDDECMQELIVLTTDEGVHFDTIVFSSEEEIVPYVGSIGLARNFEIPEGCRKIRSNTFIHQKIESLRFPSSLQKIETDAVVDCHIEAFQMNENLTYEYRVGCISDRLTGNIVLRLKDNRAKKYSKEEVDNWNRTKPYQLDFTAARFWNEKFNEYIKDRKMTSNYSVNLKSNESPFESLKRIITKLPDYSEKFTAFNMDENCTIESLDITRYLELLGEYTKYLERNEKEGEWKNYCSMHNSHEEEDVAVYVTEAVIPQELEMYFFIKPSGLELLIPYLQVYCFFKCSELNRILDFIMFLQKYAYEYARKLGDEMKQKEVAMSDSLKLFRKDILKGIEPHKKTPEEQLNENCSRFNRLASRYGFTLRTVENRDSEIITYTIENNESLSVTMTFRIGQMRNLTDEDFSAMEREFEGMKKRLI